MKIAINTSCAVAGGSITHLRNILPHMGRIAEQDEIFVIGDSVSRERIGCPDGMNWIEIPTVGNNLLGRLWFENFVLPKVLMQNRIDVLFHPNNFAVFRSPVPQVILIHNLAPFLPEVIDGESIFQRIRLRLLRDLTKKSIEIACRSIFISRWGRDLVVGKEQVDQERTPIIEFGSEHGAVQPKNGILDRWGLSRDEFILTVSHLYRYKKLEHLIEAYRILGKEVRNLPLLVVGQPFDREYADKMKRIAGELDARVIFTGSLDANELASLMSTCRLFVFTSQAENLPITLLEAMAAGCATITNRACSMPEVCMDACVYADPPNPEFYAQAILQLTRDQVVREKYRRAARRRAADYSWPRSAKKTLDLIRGIERRV